MRKFIVVTGASKEISRAAADARLSTHISTALTDSSTEQRRKYKENTNPS
jgi:NAD(P)-dependent dehydrogenase (short-subunit alcohol dehydrogenase family)